MKKTGSLLLTITLLFSLLACSSEKPTPTPTLDASAIYQETLAKQNQLTAMDVDMTMDLKMAVEEESFSLKMANKLQTSTSNDDMKMAMISSITSPELADSEMAGLEMKMYYSDGIYYMDMFDMKFKYPMNLEDVETQVTDSTSMYSFEEEELLDLSVEEINNEYKLSFKLDEGTMTELMQQALAQSGGGDLEGVNYQITSSTVQGIMYISKEKELKKEEVSMQFTIDIEGEIINMNMEMVMVVNATNENVSFTLPNFSEYLEIDPALLQ